MTPLHRTTRTTTALLHGSHGLQGLEEHHHRFRVAERLKSNGDLGSGLVLPRAQQLDT